MPFIETKFNGKISDEQREAMKKSLGEAIELIPGKSEQWLMLSFQEECSLYFHGENHMKIAFVEVKLFGKADGKAYSGLTAAITETLRRELGIDPANVYVKYEETPYWGWNGGNL